MTKPTKKFLFLHRSQPGPGAAQEQKPSPEQMQQMMATWNAWKDKFKDQIVDMGDKLKSGGKIVGGSTVSDGPFVEAKEIVGGFMIVSAASIEEAVIVAQEMPRMPGAKIEVRELAGSYMLARSTTPAVSSITTFVTSTAGSSRGLPRRSVFDTSSSWRTPRRARSRPR